MHFHLIAVRSREGKAEIVLADQAHDQGVARRVVLTFPLPVTLADDFTGREEELLDEADAILTAAQITIGRR